jgi:hypothetical protein
MRKILGIPIVLFVLGLLIVGSGAAALVKYLSNTVTYDVSVESPLEMTGDTDLTLNIFGGDTIEYSVTTINHATVAIDSYPITTLTSLGVWSGEEFIDASLTDPSGTYNITKLLYVVKSDGTLIPFTNVHTLGQTTINVYVDKTGTGTLTKYSRSIGFNELNTLAIVTNPAITPGTYNIKSCQLFDVVNQEC